MNNMAWLYKLPENMIGIRTINLLEFMTSVIIIHITIISGDGPRKILVFTDISNVLGWIYKASSSESMTKHDTVAR